MKYGHNKRVKNYRRIIFATLPILFIGAGVYVLMLIFSPAVHTPQASSSWNVPVPRAQIAENRIYIPKLKLNLTYKSGDASVLNDNVWHRFPERGDPEKGGNFILAGHRFEIGLTPGETQRRSPFYHIDALVKGDKIYADANGKRYMYEVSEKYRVNPDQTEIEAPSNEPKMTLYTCTFQGSADGREVIVAKLVKKDVDPRLEF